MSFFPSIYATIDFVGLLCSCCAGCVVFQELPTSSAAILDIDILGSRDSAKEFDLFTEQLLILITIGRVPNISSDLVQ